MSIDPARTDVFAEERQHLIARLVEEHGRARVTDLSAQFGVSQVTIRKDLEELEQQGRLVRTHGGAVAPSPGRRGARVRRPRATPAAPRRTRSAGEAAAMVVDGESIALDASTTALALARHLKARGGWLHLTVITNGLRIAAELAGHPGITVAMPGGFLRWEALSLVGPLGEGLFDKVNIQTAFMGAAGFALETGLSDATDEEAQIKRLMVQGASRRRRPRRPLRSGSARRSPRSAGPADLGAVVTDDLAPAGMVDGRPARSASTSASPRPGGGDAPRPASADARGADPW